MPGRQFLLAERHRNARAQHARILSRPPLLAALPLDARKGARHIGVASGVVAKRRIGLRFQIASVESAGIGSFSRASRVPQSVAASTAA
jgi:hypothetical protein